MRVTRLFAAMALGLVSSISLADDPDQAIRKTLASLDLGLPVESIGESPLDGIYQVQLKGGRMLYTSADGQYLMQGYLYHVQNGKPVNLTEQSESRSIAKEINAIPAGEMVVFAPRTSRPRPTSPSSPTPIAATARNCTAKCPS